MPDNEVPITGTQPHPHTGAEVLQAGRGLLQRGQDKSRWALRGGSKGQCYGGQAMGVSGIRHGDPRKANTLTHNITPSNAHKHELTDMSLCVHTHVDTDTPGHSEEK